MKFDRLFLIVALTTLLCACAVMTARADVITDWNDKVVTAGVKASQAPFVHTRSAAIVHVAMFDAVNSIDRRYTPYRVQLPAAPGTSREAAAAAAAHFALVRLYPDQAKDFDSFYQTSLATVPDGEPKSKGIQLGEAGSGGDSRSASERRRQRTQHLPPIHCGGHLCSHRSTCRLRLGTSNAFRPQRGFAVPSCGSSFSAKRAVGEGL